MLKATTSNHEDKPVSHLAYMSACQQRAALGVAARPWVQVRKKFGDCRLVLCGQVIELDAGSSSGEWFKVSTNQGALWIESRNVRMCSGDGRCTCEIERQGERKEGVSHRAPLPDARQADWRSGRAEVCPPPTFLQEPPPNTPARGAQCSA